VDLKLYTEDVLIFFFCNFTLFSKKIHVYTRVVNPTLDPFLGTMTYGAEVTRLGAEARGQGLRG